MSDRPCAPARLAARQDYAEAHLGILHVYAGDLQEAARVWNPAWARILAHKDAYNIRTIRAEMEEALESAGELRLEDQGYLPV
jgi:hypothetical protein